MAPHRQLRKEKARRSVNGSAATRQMAPENGVRRIPFPSGPPPHCGRPPGSVASMQTTKRATSYHCLTTVLHAATTYILLRFPKRHSQEQGRDASVPLSLPRQSRGPARSKGHTSPREERPANLKGGGVCAQSTHLSSKVNVAGISMGTVIRSQNPLQITADTLLNGHSQVLMPDQLSQQLKAASGRLALVTPSNGGATIC